MKGGLDDQEADSMMEEDDGNKFFYQKWSVRIIFLRNCFLIFLAVMVELFKGINVEERPCDSHSATWSLSHRHMYVSVFPVPSA